jgi:hypothetical protein
MQIPNNPQNGHRGCANEENAHQKTKKHKSQPLLDTWCVGVWKHFAFFLAVDGIVDGIVKATVSAKNKHDVDWNKK